MTLPTSAQSLIVYSVAHFGNLLTFDCSNFTSNGKRLKQTVNSEGKNSLDPFPKELKVVLLYSIKTVVYKFTPVHVMSGMPFAWGVSSARSAESLAPFP